MKIAVSSSGKEPDSPVDSRFGRAAWFVVVDTDTNEWFAVENAQNLNLPQGAGIQAGKTVAETGAKVLLTGHIGPKAFKVLEAAGIKVYLGATGTVQDAVTAFTQGKLAPADGPDKEGHWV
ncbi:MAG: NifB/NifX family molybdenum-iron cluster-binding protein [Deltaproteobacteria bacterium]|nr:NifB/NifX family molybdenum-iron cluster-binding protein [Deltaproteobacteria bacterium]